MHRDLGGRFFHTNLGPEINFHLDGWFASFRKRLRLYNRAYADIHFQKVVEAYFGHVLPLVLQEAGCKS